MDTISTNGLALITQNYNHITDATSASLSTFGDGRSSSAQNNFSYIHYWSTAKKIELLSSFSRCSTPLCVCTGWKHEQSAVLNGDDNTAATEQSKKLYCTTCQHSFDCHSNRWLNANEQQIEYGIQLLLDADWLITMGASNEHDLSTNRIILFTAQVLHNTIGDPFNYSVSAGLGNLIGSPPFEQPTILTAVINFVAYQYTKAIENKIQIIFEAAKHFLHLINTWKMPSIVSYILSKQKTEQTSINSDKVMKTIPKNDETILTDEKPQAAPVNGDESQPSCSSSSSFSQTTSTKKPLDNREYELWYARWTSYCILPQICNKTMIKYDCINIFGLTYMKYIYEHFKVEILKRIEQRQLSSSLVFQNFIDSFQQTFDETSPSHCCWNKCYERPIIPIEAEIYTFTQSKQQSSSSDNSSQTTLPPTISASTTTTTTATPTTIKYEPEKKVTRRVSKALTNKRRLETPTSLQTIDKQSLTSSSSSINSYHPYSHEFARKIWSNVKEHHQKRIQAEIEKTLYKANPKRDEVARLAEQRGFAEFHLIKHNLQTSKTANETDIMYKRLLQLINVFSRALPKMPQNYIARTVLDPRHQSLVIIFTSKVIGGITYRMFQHRNFTEIVFCAVSEYQQVRGYGTHLMNHLKDYHIKKNIKHLLTYADGFAVGYFKKQGFSSTITLNENVYLGYIKDYDGATLMQCDLYNDICYTKLTETFTLIKDCLHTLKLYKHQELLHCYGEKYGARFAMDDDSNENTDDRKQMIPDVLFNEQNDEQPDVLYITLNGVYKEIRQHSNSIYVQRLKLNSLSTNDHTILYPIDLDLIQERLKVQYYQNSYTFIADMSRLLHLSRHIYEQKKEYQDIKLFDAFVRRKMNEFGLEMPNNAL